MIKYRVYDNKCNTYLNLVGAEIGNHNTKFCGFKYVYLKPQNEEVKIQNPTPRYGGCVGFKLTDSADANRLIFEQYTGLKDRNGVEIYEGDIVKHRGYYGRAKNSAVEFNKGCFNTGEHDGSSTRKRPMLLQNNCEVIGNIHENAELLEEK